MGRQVVAGEGSRDLVRAEALEEARGGEVAALAVGLGQGVVGDLADQGLDEGVLAVLRAARVGLEGEQLAANEPAQSRLELGLVDPGHGGEARRGEALADDRGIRHERPVVGGEAVEPARDERRQRFGDRQAGQVADRSVGAVDDGKAPLGDEHPDRLDGIQRDAVRAGDDGRDRRGGQARDESGEELAHGDPGRAARDRAR